MFDSVSKIFETCPRSVNNCRTEHVVGDFWDFRENDRARWTLVNLLRTEQKINGHISKHKKYCPHYKLHKSSSYPQMATKIAKPSEIHSVPCMQGMSRILKTERQITAKTESLDICLTFGKGLMQSEIRKE